jgi:rod shape-determining protein MreC
MGGKNKRVKKADLFSGTVFYPFIENINNFRKNKDLMLENAMLKNTIAANTIKINILKTKLDKYKDISGLNLDKTYDYKIANVIGYQNSFLEKTLLIDKGYYDNIKKDMPVLDYLGIIGKIITVAKNYSVVLPYTNSNFHISVMISKNNEQGILKSKIGGEIYVDYLSLDSEISIGDTVITSNLSKIFPEGYPVGVVEKISISKDKMHKIAKLKMFNNPNALKTVVILFYQKEDNYE